MDEPRGWQAIHQPQDHAQHHADDERGHQRKIEGEVRTVPVDPAIRTTHLGHGIFECVLFDRALIRQGQYGQ